MKTYVANIFFLVVVLFCTCLLSCTDDESVQVVVIPKTETLNDLRKIIPLKVGNSWTYYLRECDIFGESCSVKIQTAQITSFDEMNSKKHFRFNTRALIDIGWDVEPHYETVDSTTYSQYICVNCLGFEKSNIKKVSMADWLPLHLLRTPIIDGAAWKVADWDTLYGWDFGKLKIVNADTTITIAAGTFQHAIHIESEEQSMLSYIELFIVPGIGVVKAFHYNATELFSSKIK